MVPLRAPELQGSQLSEWILLCTNKTTNSDQDKDTPSFAGNQTCAKLDFSFTLCPNRQLLQRTDHTAVPR